MESQVPESAAASPNQQQQSVGSPSETTDGTVSNSTLQNEATSGGQSDGGKAASASATAKASRKRTKTGCLTCRKRRIKCGEERPTCGNCIKSKRVCEGYNQRVVFKDGMNGMYRPGMLGAAGGSSSMDNRRMLQPYPIQPAPAPGSAAALQPIAIAPAPPPVSYSEPITPLDQTKPPHLRNIYAQQQRRPGGFQDHGQNIPLTPMTPLTPLDSHGHQEQYGHQEAYHQQVPVSHSEDGGQYPAYYPQAGNSVTGSFSVSPGPNERPPPPRSPLEPNSTSMYSSQFFAGQYGGAMSTSDFAPSHPSAVQNSNSCPFDPPLDSKYAMVSGGGGQLNQPGQEYAGLLKSPDNLHPTSVSSPLLDQSLGGSSLPVPAGSGHNFHFLGPEVAHLSLYPETNNEYGPDDDDDDEDDDLYDVEDEEDDDEEDYEVRELDEMILDPEGQAISPRAHISNVIEPHSRHLNEHTRISFRTFLPDLGVLTNYHPTMSSSPLMNSTTAKIFCHFIYVLGPSLSLFERQPPNPHIAFTPGAGLHGPQNVWSYTIPMLSLSHPPLMHAILALSSLHISKLTKGPTHPSLLHYHIALRRLGRAIASDRHRGHVATLSATLLLGYYETMAAEHDKWSSHIHGAKQLLKEIDFDRVTKRVELLDEEERRSQQNQNIQHQQHQQHQSQFGLQQPEQPSILRLRKMRRQQVYQEVDENFTALLSGGKARRRPHMSGRRNEKSFSNKELDVMQLQADMFWWFAKMDCYQSLISGCPLVLDYIYWSQCPPRARIGTLGTTYGSSDHFFLLLGRVCAFQERDLKRKKAVMKANGGRWIPPPDMGGPPRGMGRGRGRGGPPADMNGGFPSGMQRPPPEWNRQGSPSNWGGLGMNGPPSRMTGIPSSGFGGQPMGGGGQKDMNGGPQMPFTQGPPIGGNGIGRGMGMPPNMNGGGSSEQIQYGMAPTPSGPPRVPQAFAENFPDISREEEQKRQLREQSPEDLDVATLEAEIEWNAILKAFQVFQESLGPEYQPLPIEYMPVQNTPFGEAIYYRTYSIATLQMLYYMAMIVLQRCHPSMPAISMMAAGVAAPKTGRMAVDIARITAGLVPTDPTGQINPALGASLIESSMPLFFAAVQYQEQAQREWVVMKLREISRLTGWATAMRVLLGCQRAWEKAAEMGKGPKYERPPFEEEGELFYEWMHHSVETRGGEPTDTAMAGGDEGNGRYVWRTAGRRLAGAAGILGSAGEDFGIGNMGI